MPNFDFVDKRKIFIAMSVVLIVISGILLFTKGLNLGVDFTGGVEVGIVLSNPDLSVGDIRNKLSAENGEFEAARIVKQRPLSSEEQGKNSRFSITLSTERSGDEIESEIIQALSGDGATEDSILSVNNISGYAAQEISGYAFTAVIVAIAIILLYITIRFKFSFGIGAILAVAHDIIITLGFYSLFGMEFNAPVIAALLTLLGYSLNDTIVVYDRVRENMKRMRGQTIEKVVNDSINQVIVRSINTSLTTFIVILCLFIFSGEVLRPFAFGMLVGVIVGTYSSLYISAPIVIGWFKKSEEKKKR
jgi:preprotein translocase subunit SecF